MASTSNTHRKPGRLSLACNQCRKRKVRCDASQPKCRNCTFRGENCETSDPKRLRAAPVVRRRHAARRHSTLGIRNRETDGTTPRTPRAAQAPNAAFAPSPAESAPTEVHRRRVSGFRNQESPRGPHSTGSISGRSASAAGPSGLTPEHGESRHLSRQDPDRVSWVSKAYQESTVAQVERSQYEPAETENTASAVTPDIIVNTDGSPNKLKVCTHRRHASTKGGYRAGDFSSLH